MENQDIRNIKLIFYFFILIKFLMRGIFFDKFFFSLI